MLKKILQNVKYQIHSGSTEVEITDFCFDSRQARIGSLFIALKGTQTDGHQYIGVAQSAGAVAVVCEDLPESFAEGVTYIQVEDSAAALAFISANFYGNPAAKLRITGITGTNGKTSTATLLWKCMNELGYKSGLISTISYKIGMEERASSHTTPDPKQLHRIFAEMVEAGCVFCFMEVSSHALEQKRVEGIRFEVAAFTNLTHDHLDYHLTFAAYLKAKKKLFDNLDNKATAIINADDKNGNVMVQNCKANVLRYSLQRETDFRAKVLENTFEGLLLDINGTEVWFRLVGRFNASNLLAVYAAMTALGIESEAALSVLSAQKGVSGRFEAIYSPDGSITAIVDYAHTPDALKNVLDTINEINQTRGNVLTVVGCGGNRDKTKRPVMAKIAAENSNTVILTSDNPRFEKPDEILAEMSAGVPLELKRNVFQIENRKEAIGVAVRLAKPADIILIAGKGHETYQEIEGVKYPFDDKETVKNYLDSTKK
ncbi:MAG: UDP-N-acetylmuramoyl-L-alanyl-D-glutamate--2,6-diaminopimelate ligase [Bacteroidia bacterium]|nr:UDP-N-acetylmuramoyl-L-alanyl-D-glutamate--2,6-diaminopimelate ligase [Bacteroidia bacterium]